MNSTDNLKHIIVQETPRYIGLLVMLIGTTVLIGWLLELRPILGLFLSFPTMKFNTSVLLILSGVILQLKKTQNRRYRIIGSIILLVSLLTFIQYLLGINIGIDELILRDTFSRQEGIPYPGRMSPMTAVNFAIFGAGTLLISYEHRYYAYCALAIFTMSLLAIASYLYNALELFDVFVFATMALHTAIGFFILSIGLLLKSTQHPIVQLLIIRGSSGHMIRHLLPTTVIVLLLTGFVAYSGQQLEWYGVAVTIAITVVSNILIIGFIIFWTALDIQNFSMDLQHSENRFRMILEMAEQGIILVDENGKIVHINPYGQYIFQMGADELIGRNIDTLIPVDKRARHHLLRADYVVNPVARPMGKNRELEALRGDGTIFPVEVSLSPLKIAGEIYIVAFVIDITERKALAQERLRIQTLKIELQKERELHTLKSRFVSITSHEFRTPLAIINSSIGMVQRYYQNYSEEDVQAKLTKAQNQIKFLEQMLGDLLTVKKIEDEVTSYQPETIDLSLFITDIVENVEIAFEKDAYITVHVEDGTIMVDPNMLQHILFNLLSNAIKYSPNGTPVILRVSQLKMGWQFVVKDEGIGIPAEDLDHLFQPFHRAGNVGNIQGSGLGLVIVKNYIKIHGGTIEVTSEENKGTTVTFFLPMESEVVPIL